MVEGGLGQATKPRVTVADGAHGLIVERLQYGKPVARLEGPRGTGDPRRRKRALASGPPRKLPVSVVHCPGTTTSPTATMHSLRPFYLRIVIAPQHRSDCLRALLCVGAHRENSDPRSFARAYNRDHD